MTGTYLAAEDVVAAGCGRPEGSAAYGPAATTRPAMPLFTVDDHGRVFGADGYERGACAHCLHRSMRLYGGRLANHAEFRWRWRWFGWRWVRMLTPTTDRCPGSGEPPRRPQSNQLDRAPRGTE